MTTKRRSLAELLDRATAAEASAVPAPEQHPGAKPHAGGFMGSLMREQNKGLVNELDRLREEVARKRDAIPSAVIDPARVRRSKFANRVETAFLDQDFALLRTSIEHKSGNTSPIVVRPIADDPKFDYEIASGHRRHQACLETGQPLHAIIKDMTDEELVTEMFFENHRREDPSAFEMAFFFKRLLASGIYSSLRKLAEAVDMDHAEMVRMLNITEIPADVLDAFTDKREIRVYWAPKILGAIKQNAKAVRVRAAELAGKNLPAKRVFDAIVDRPKTVDTYNLSIDGKIYAKKRLVDGKPAIVFTSLVTQEQIEMLTKVIESHLRKSGT